MAVQRLLWTALRWWFLLEVPSHLKTNSINKVYFTQCSYLLLTSSSRPLLWKLTIESVHARFSIMKCIIFLLFLEDPEIKNNNSFHSPTWHTQTNDKFWHGMTWTSNYKSDSVTIIFQHCKSFWLFKSYFFILAIHIKWFKLFRTISFYSKAHERKEHCSIQFLQTVLLFIIVFSLQYVILVFIITNILILSWLELFIYLIEHIYGYRQKSFLY